MTLRRESAESYALGPLHAGSTQVRLMLSLQFFSQYDSHTLLNWRRGPTSNARRSQR